MEGYSAPIRLDRNCHGGGIIFYVRSDLPCKELKCLKVFMLRSRLKNKFNKNPTEANKTLNRGISVSLY